MTRTNSLTILLIEDNEQNRYLTTFLLERHGHVVLSASSGPQAIATAREHAPDLVLLDIHLPLMDGYDVARALRTISALQTTPIIAVTAYAMVGDRERALESGCNGYIEKPIDPETFVDEVTSYARPLRAADIA
jgi:two-component system cell cycle response regulator DivK